MRLKVQNSKQKHMATKQPTRHARRRRPAKRRSKIPPKSKNEILAWENDPFAQSRPSDPPSFATPIARSTPDLQASALGISITGPRPTPQRYNPGTGEFRYWTAAEALRRTADFWAPLLPAGTKWHSTVGSRLRVTLDAGEDLNAYYDRHGLDFFHGSAGRTIIYSGESPDVVCHEFGHAVLDALRPQLWNAGTAEAASFHESFGDMSALLSALQLQSVRERVLLDTQGQIYKNSQLSRLAEQLGWAIRQGWPDAVEGDCLRNAVNAFFYKDPTTLSPNAPASLLSSEPHSFSRVFTSAFFEALAGIFKVLGDSGEQNLQKASAEAARLLLQGIRSAPIVPSYYSQVAAGMLAAAGATYHQVLAGAFMRHGILAPESVHFVATGAKETRSVAAIAADLGGADLATTAIQCAEYGLGVDTILVHVASQPRRFNVAGAAPSAGSLLPPASDEAAKSFVEDLIRLGRIDLQAAPGTSSGMVALHHSLHRKSHILEKTSGGLTLKRRHFDCGFACCAS